MAEEGTEQEQKKVKGPADIESEVLSHWKEKDILRRLLRHNEGKPYFRFLEGPPTANAPPGVHHIFSRTVKDTVCRYRNMKGSFVPRMGGWDCHGLPVEIAVEKKLGIENKDQIEKYGIEPFIKQCRDSVFSHIGLWSKMTERLGVVLDLEHPYITMKDDYIESVWWSLKEIWKKGFLDEGHMIVPYCPRCGTSLSSHEVAQGYREVEDPSIFVRFKVKDQENTFILAWTTTPWTLISNVALAVSPDETYLKASYKGSELIFAEKRVGALLKEGEYVVLQRMLGSDLEGTRYEPLYSFAKPDRAAHFVATADFVTMEDGTGVVHIAPAFGEDDFNLGRTYDLPMLQPVKEDGTFSDVVTPWKGRFVKDADPEIIEDLRTRGLLEGVHSYAHQYPFCWRCDTPLLYYARKAFYIRMSRIRELLLSNNEQITWYPGNIKNGRFGKFLEEVKDWNLSRERYWGTPLPFWRCPCGNELMVGSREELKALSGIEHIPELHRPYVDEITIPCKKCGKQMVRVPYVIDCWYDSGSAFFASLHYPFENEEEWKRQFPRDYIAEGIDQTRGWFYSLLAVSTAVFGQPSYRSVICHAHVLDAEGKKMSKSKGNVVDPWKLFESEGADAIRWYLLSSSDPWKPKLFSVEAVRDANRSFLGTLRNVMGFYRTYADLDGYRPGSPVPVNERPEIDRWLLSKLDELVSAVDGFYDRYDLTDAAASIQRFVVDDLSNWYVRVNRRRFWGTESSSDKKAAYDTLSESLKAVSLLCAPIIPFHSEWVYRGLGLPDARDSVHFEPFPEARAGTHDEDLGPAMELVKKIVDLGRAARGLRNIKTRQPLARAVIKGPEPLVEGLLSMIRSELNVRELSFEKDLSGYFERTAEVDPKKLGPRLRAAAGPVKEELLKLDPRELALRVEKGPIDVAVGGTTYQIGKEDLRFHEVLPDRWALGSEGDLEVLLDLEITEELWEEGIAREVVRRVQTMRKDMDLPYDAHINVAMDGERKLISAVEHFRAYIMSETLTDSLVFGPTGSGTEWDLDDGKLVITITVA
ncbi:MAG: isoleucine--tRNA ligase [Candidatus Thermoplasmatota archaeon]|nr:isoleucine--tRNA ligase [Candidatus Thermoplasmatota archaeon]